MNTEQDSRWRLIEEDERGVTYWPKNSRHQPRFEMKLPSGDRVIDDFPAGLVLVSNFYGKANFEAGKSKGRRLGQRSVRTRENDDEVYYEFVSQETYADDDSLESRVVRLITEYRGKVLVRQVEFDPKGARLTNNEPVRA